MCGRQENNLCLCHLKEKKKRTTKDEEIIFHITLAPLVCSSEEKKSLVTTLN